MGLVALCVLKGIRAVINLCHQMAPWWEWACPRQYCLLLSQCACAVASLSRLCRDGVGDDCCHLFTEIISLSEDKWLLLFWPCIPNVQCATCTLFVLWFFFLNRLDWCYSKCDPWTSISLLFHPWYVQKCRVSIVSLYSNVIESVESSNKNMALYLSFFNLIFSGNSFLLYSMKVSICNRLEII